MPSLKKLDEKIEAAKANVAAAKGQTVVAPAKAKRGKDEPIIYTDADPSAVAKVMRAIGTATEYAWAVNAADTSILSRFAVVLPNGATANVYINSAGTTAAKTNATHPNLREKRERAEATDPTAGL